MFGRWVYSYVVIFRSGLKSQTHVKWRVVAKHVYIYEAPLTEAGPKQGPFAIRSIQATLTIARGWSEDHLGLDSRYTNYRRRDTEIEAFHPFDVFIRSMNFAKGPIAYGPMSMRRQLFNNLWEKERQKGNTGIRLGPSWDEILTIYSERFEEHQTKMVDDDKL